MIKIESYSKVWNIDKGVAQTLFGEEVWVQEKIDGSQFSFMKDEDGYMRYRSKGREIFEGSADKLFSTAIAWCEANQDKLRYNHVYRAEAMRGPKHNHLEYGRAPAAGMVLFDVYDNETDLYFTHEQMEAEGLALQLETVPLIWSGVLDAGIDVKWLKALVQGHTALLGGDFGIEGIVIKPVSGIIDPRTNRRLLVKYVRDDFKEGQNATFKKDNPTKTDVIQGIINANRTEARWRKAVQHLRDDGQLKHAPQDIGPLLKEIERDFKEEMEEQVSAMLWNHFKHEIVRGVQRGFPNFYKEQLIEEALSS